MNRGMPRAARLLTIASHVKSAIFCWALLQKATINWSLISIVTFSVCGTGGQVLGDPPGPIAFDEILFREDFGQLDGTLLDPSRWVVNHPESWWWVLGRTFFPSPVYHPDGPFPHVQDGACVIEHYHYNPYHLGTPKTTFLGGEIHTVMEFDPIQCYRFEARVRWPQCPKGLVSSFFTYGYDVEHKDSDEIDVELLSNEVFKRPEHQVLTNTWNDSKQKPVHVSIPDIDLREWQTFRIYWYPDPRVEWTWIDPLGDERLLRSEADVTHLPDEPMSLYFNFWAPTSDWPEAYDAGLQPNQQDNSVKHEYWIDYVEVRVGEGGVCDQPGACCFPDGTCEVLTAAECAAAGGTYQGDSTDCSPNPCVQPPETGACCFSDGTCDELTTAECAAAGGTYQGDGTDCSPDPCGPPTGACCLPDGSCIETTETECESADGAFLGNESTCDGTPCRVIPPDCGAGACPTAAIFLITLTLVGMIRSRRK